MKTGILELMSWRRFFPALIPKIEKNESNMVLIKVTVKKKNFSNRGDMKNKTQNKNPQVR